MKSEKKKIFKIINTHKFKIINTITEVQTKNMSREKKSIQRATQVEFFFLLLLRTRLYDKSCIHQAWSNTIWPYSSV